MSSIMLRFFIALFWLFTPAFAEEGEKIMLEARPALVISGKTTSEKMLETLKARLLQFEAMTKEKAEMMSVFSIAEDGEFILKTYYPVTLPLKDTTPSGERLKFIHRGAYDLIDQTYEEIADFLDAKGLIAEDEVEESYPKDLRTTPENELIVVITIKLKQKK